MHESAPSLLLERIQADALLAPLTDTELARLLGSTEPVSFSAGQTLYRRGEPTRGVFLFTEGEVYLSCGSREALPMQDLRCGEESLAGLPYYICEAVTTRALKGWRVSDAGLASVLPNHPEIKSNAMLALSRYHGDQPVVDGKERAPEKSSTFSKKECIGWFFAMILPLIVFMLGERFQLSDQASIFAAILTVAVVMWVFSLVDEFIPPLLTVVATLFIGLAPSSVALAGFSSPTFITLLGVFALSATISASGLSYRLMMWLLHKLPDRAGYQQSALLLSGYVMSAITPSGNSRFALLLPLYRDMAEGLRLPKGGIMATGLMASAFSGAMLFSPMMVTSKAPNLTALGMLPQQVQEQFQGLFWLTAAAVAALTQTVLHFVAMHWIFKGSNPGPLPKDRIATQLTLLGGLRYPEKIALLGFIFFLLGASTVSFHHIQPALIAGCVLLGLLLSGVFSKQSFRQKLDWPMIFFLLGMDSITRIMHYLGLDTQLAQALSSSYGFINHSITLFILAALVTTVILRLFLPTVAGMLVSAIVLIPVAQANGIHPWIGIFLVAVFSDIWFAPYQIGVYSQIKSEGLETHLDQRRFMRYNHWMNAARVAIVFISIPYWQWLGLL